MNCIVFDGWGVVFTEPDDVANKLTPFVLRHNPSETFDHILGVYRQASAGAITAGEFWSRLGLGDRYPQIQDEMLDSYYIYDEAFGPVADDLQKRYRLGLLSNDLSEWSSGLRRRYGIERYFQVVVISDEARSRKPDRGIYETFLRRAGAAGRDCLFIDDRLRNLKGAAEVGMRTCWFDRTGVPDGDFRPDVRIESLPELPGAVARVLHAG